MNGDLSTRQLGKFTSPNRLKNTYNWSMARKGLSVSQAEKKTTQNKPGQVRARSMGKSAPRKSGDELYRILAEAAHDMIYIVDCQGKLQYINSYAANQVGLQTKGLIGKALTDLFSADFLAGATNNFNNIISTGEPHYTEGQVVLKKQSKWLGTWLVPLKDEAGQVSSVMGVSRDITEQKQVEETLRHRNEEMAAFQATVLDLTGHKDLFSLLRTIVERSMTLLRAPGGFIYLYQEATNDLELVTELGWTVPAGVRLKMGEGMAGKVAKSRKTLIVKDYSTWKGRSAKFQNVPYHAIVEAPMVFREQLIGVLGVNDNNEQLCKFTDEDAHLLSLFAGQAASAVHETRLVENLQSELTERKRAEDLLKSAEIRHLALVEQIPAIVYTDSVAEVGRSHYISPQIKTILGFDPQQWSLNNDLWIKAMHPDDRERVLADYDRTFKTGEPFIAEYRMISSERKTIWIQDKAVLTRDQSGTPLFWQGFMLDITERKQAEGALKESEERYRRLFDLSPDAIAVHSSGRIILVNQAAMNLLGAKSPDQITDKPLMDFVHPDYRELVIQRTRLQLNTGSVVPTVEEKFLRLDGTAVDVDVTAAPIHYQDKPASLVIFRDITERKRAQTLQEAVYRIAVAAEKAKSLDDLYPQVHEIISSVMPAENFYITLYDEEKDVLRFTYFKDFQDEPYLDEIQPGDGLTAYVLRTGKSLLCTQAVHNELERQGAVKLLGVSSAIWLGVPLILDGKTIGAMVVQHYTDPEAYSEREQHMLEFVSSQVAISIGRKQAEDALQKQLKEITVLHNVSTAAAQASSIDQLVELTTRIIGEMIYLDNFGIDFLDEKNGELIPHQSYRGGTYSQPDRIPISDGIVGHVASTGEPCCIGDVRKHPKYLMVEPETRSELCVPIKVRVKVIGVINAESNRIDFFTQDDERLLNTIAGTLATAIEKFRLFEAEHNRREEAETMRQVSVAVSSTLELNKVLETVLASLGKVIPHESASVHLVQSDGELNLVAERGLPKNHQWIGRRSQQSSLWGTMADTRKPLILANAQLEPAFEKVKETDYIRGWMGVPLIVRDEVIGYIALDSRQENTFTPEETILAATFAHQAAIAVDNARLYEEAVTAADRRSILHRASQEIAQASRDPEKVYAAVHRAASQLMPTEAFAITLLDETRQETMGVYLWDKGGRSPLDRAPAKTGLSGLVISSGKPVITHDLTIEPIPGSVHFGDKDEVRSVLAVPLRLGEKVTGMLSVQSYKPYAYSDEDQSLLEQLAANAAVAIDNARLYAETFQRLKELEAVNHISTALRSARTVEEMLPSLLNETLQVLGIDSGMIWLYDKGSGYLKPAVVRGWFASINETPIKPGEGVAGKVFETGEVISSKEFATDHLTRESTRDQIPKGWGGACIPIRTVQETMGVLFVSVHLPRELQPDEIHLLVTLSEMAGNAVRRADLHEQTERQVQRLASLRAVDMAINTILDLRVTLGILIDHIISQLKVDAVNILLINPNTQTLYHAASSGFRSDAIRNIQLYVGDSLAGQAARTRNTVYVPDLNQIKNHPRVQVLTGEGFVTYFGVPLIAKGQVKGILETFHRSLLEPDAEWRNFLDTLAGQAAIAIDNSMLFEELQQTNLNLSMAYDATIEGWSKALDLRDQETEGHTLRVAEMTLHLADIMGINSTDMVHIRRGALLHDIGKMGVPDSILHKPGPLTDEEWVIMQRHPVFAYEMLSPIAYLRQAIDIPYAHHERWDGSGYPRHLVGEQIPQAARIFAVVDVWDALMSDRPYRKAWTKDAVIEYLRKSRGELFDPQVVDVFLPMVSG
jgi:PAS domain S-box-containing protein/putative nucleotidyltransferase with HDIG domain